MTVLQVKSLCVKDVVHDVAFSIAPGERVGLIGESGSGKTGWICCQSGIYARFGANGWP